MKATIVDLRYRMKDVISALKRNEKVYILYHGKETWKVRRFSDYFEVADEVFYRFIPEFEYLLTDLSGYSNEDIKQKVFKKVSLEIALLVMKNIFKEKVLEKMAYAVIGRIFIPSAGAYPDAKRDRFHVGHRFGRYP